MIPPSVPQAAVLEAACQRGFRAKGGEGAEDLLQPPEETPAGGGYHQPQ